jgi:hypothetical protein
MFSPASISVYNTDSLLSIYRTVVERVFLVKQSDGTFLPPPLPAKDVFNRRCGSFRSLLRSHFRHCRPVSRSQFLKVWCPAEKRKIYTRAQSNLDAQRQLKRRMGGFLKYEKSKKGRDLAVRLITSPSPEYGLELGRYLVPYEKKLYQAIDKVFDLGHPVILKGYNAKQQARFIRYPWKLMKDPVCVMADAKRFDQHVSNLAKAFENGVYLEAFDNPTDSSYLAELLEHQNCTDIRFRCSEGVLTFSKIQGRDSGTMNTSTGNNLLSAAMAYSFRVAFNLTFHVFINGDDIIFIMERSELSCFVTHFKPWYLDFGFTMEVEMPVDIFECIVFCQTQPVYVGPELDDYIMVRDPTTAMSKDVISITPLNNAKDKRTWLRAVGMGGIALTGGIPMFQSFYQAFVRNSTGDVNKRPPQHMSWWVANLAKDMRRRVSPISDRTRDSFFLAFGINASRQRQYELYFDTFQIKLNEEMTYEQERRLLEQPFPLLISDWEAIKLGPPGNWPKTVEDLFNLNNSVLNKMPNDCTAPTIVTGQGGCTVSLA